MTQNLAVDNNDHGKQSYGMRQSGRCSVFHPCTQTGHVARCSTRFNATTDITAKGSKISPAAGATFEVEFILEDPPHLCDEEVARLRASTPASRKVIELPRPSCPLKYILEHQGSGIGCRSLKFEMKMR